MAVDLAVFELLGLPLAEVVELGVGEGLAALLVLLQKHF